MKNKQCAICGNKLGGTNKTLKGTKSKPTRKFTGILCNKCLERTVKLKTRLDEGTITNIDLQYKPYVEQLKITTKKPEKKIKKKKKK